MLVSDNHVVGCGREQRQSVDNAVTAELETAVCTTMTRLLGKATIAPVARRSTTYCRLLWGLGPGALAGALCGTDLVLEAVIMASLFRVVSALSDP